MGKARVRLLNLLFILVAILIAVYAWIASLEQGSWLAGITALLLTLWSMRPQPASETENNVGQLEAAAEYLVNKAREYWRSEATLRGLAGSPALRLRWSPGNERLSDRTMVDRGQPGQARYPAEVVTTYRTFENGRLVILGDQGGGKTGWATLLVLGLLEEHEQGSPIPVLIPLVSSSDSWDPSSEHLYEWLARRLVNDFPGLTNAGAYGTDAARRLATSGQILPVLDGLDELPANRRRAAVKSLNQQIPATAPLVLTCRTKVYRNIAKNDVVQAAAVIQLQPLKIDDIIEFLTPRHTTNKWNAVFDKLRTHRRGALARTLSNPLMISLARLIYGDDTANPSKLTDDAIFTNQMAIEGHLLDNFIPAVFRANNTPSAVPRKRRYQNPDQAKKWLYFFASRMHYYRLDKLEWWQIHRFTRTGSLASPASLIHGVFMATLFGGISLWLTFENPKYSTGEAWNYSYYAALLGFFFGGPMFMLAVHFGGIFHRPPQHFGGLRGLSQRLEAVHGKSMIIAYMSAAAVGFGLAPRAGVGMGLVAANLFLLMYLLSRLLGIPASTAEASTPRNLLRGDRMLTLVRALIAALFFGGFGFLLGGNSVALGIGLALLSIDFVILYDPFSGLAWPPFAIARAWYALLGKSPWRLFRFLEEAHRLGVLRQVGGSYEFRHSRLLDHISH
jgi:hypothetical protein